MATVHVAQTLFLAKQMVPCTVRLVFSTVLSEHCFMHDYACPLIGIQQHGTLNRIPNGLQFTKHISAKLPTVLIHQTFLPLKFLTIWYVQDRIICIKHCDMSSSTHTFVTVSVKTVLNSTFGILRNTILKHWSHYSSLLLDLQYNWSSNLAIVFNYFS